LHSLAPGTWDLIPEHRTVSLRLSTSTISAAEGGPGTRIPVFY
jgi:hypothetical protein